MSSNQGSGGLFGAGGASSGGLFGSTNTGGTSSGGNLFGTTASSGQSSGLFGQNTPSQSTATGAGSLFGSGAPAVGASSIFGKSTNTTFGASTNTPGASTPTGTGSSLFGGASSTVPKSAAASGSGFSFGSTQIATPPGSATPTQSSTAPSNIFGTTTPAPNKLFSGVQNNMFGTSTTPAAPPPTTLGNSVFGASTGATPTDSTKPAAASAAATGLFGNTSSTSLFGAGQKLNSATSTASNLFSTGSSGAATPGGSSMFGSQPTTAEASKPPMFGTGASSLFGNTKPTTPAPSGAATPAASNPFGGPAGSLFGSQAPTASGTATPSTIFGSKGSETKPGTSGGLFGSDPSKPAITPAAGTPTTETKPAGLFGAPTTTEALKPSLFGPTGTATTQAAVTQAAASDASKPPTNMFNSAVPPAKPGVSSLFSTGAGAGAGATGQTNTGGLFGGPAATATATSKPTTPGLFGGATAPATVSTQPGSLFGTTAPTTTTAPNSAITPSTTAAPASLFSSKPTDKPATPSTVTPTAGGGGLFGAGPSGVGASAVPASATTATPAPTTAASGLFGTKPGAPTVTTATDPGKTTTASATAAPTTQSAASAPVQPASRLKNKSLDELITRWTSDLDKYTTEFNKQASEIAGWDRLLVVNGDKLVELHTETLKATKKQEDINKALEYVVGQQEELAAALELYEKQVDDIFQTQIGGPEGMQPADQEREKSYLLAEKLDKQLDVMSKGLGNIITDINNATSTINKTSSAEDPLATIVKILNNHLGALQEIDVRSNTLQGKIDTARTVRDASLSNNGLGGQDMNDFFASQAFRGGR